MAIKIAGTEVISDDKRILNNESLPDIRPSLLLDFANSKTLDPRITFTRGSTATYYDGKTTAKAEENLLKYSQEFERTGYWGSNLSITGDTTTAPDGTTTADTLTVNAEGPYRGMQQRVSSTPSTTYTYTAYIKAGNHDYAGIQIQNQNNNTFFSGISYLYINLTNGSVLNSNGTTSATDVGNGWYRIEVTGTTPSSGASQVSAFVELVDSAGAGAPAPNIATGSYIYAWGAQLEQRSSATAYTVTTDSPIVKYQPVLQTAASGEARFDHDPVTGESKGLLIEEARTNLSVNSVPVAGWSVNPDVKLMGYEVAPDGTIAAPYYMQLGTGSDASINNTDIPISASSSTNYCISCFVKKAPDGHNKAVFYNFFLGNSTKGSRFEYTFSTDTLAAYEADGGGVVPFNYGREFVGNGWVRIWYVVNDAHSGLNSSLGTRFYTGNRDVINYQGLIVWGFQVEVGSFPTSYIPTSGSTVTRAVEQVTMPNISPELNGQEGTLYVEATPPDYSTGDQRLVSIGSSHSNVVEMFREYSSTNFFFAIRHAGTTISQGSTAWAADTTAKAVIGYKSGDTGFAADGTLIMTNTGTFAGMEMNQMLIGRTFQGGASAWSGEIKKIAYYPKRLPNATLQAMTEE